MGPLANWQVHSTRSTYTIQLPSEFSKEVDQPFYNDRWGYVSFSIPNSLVIIDIDYAPSGSLIYLDLFGVAGSWLEEPVFDSYTVDTLSFKALSDTVARGSYRMTNNTQGYCDAEYQVLFVRDESHIFRISVSVCDSARWKYGADFADRVLNSFTY